MQYTGLGGDCPGGGVLCPSCTGGRHGAEYGGGSKGKACLVCGGPEDLGINNKIRFV